MSLGPKDPEETKLAVFDFVNEVEPGVTLASAFVTCAIYQGTDPAAASVVQGSATVSGTKVVQRITGGVDGSDYKLRAKATDVNGLVHVITDILPVRTQ